MHINLTLPVLRKGGMNGELFRKNTVIRALGMQYVVQYMGKISHGYLRGYLMLIR